MKSISKIISAVSLAAVMTVQSAAGVFADTLSNDVIYNSDGIISMDEVAIDESVSDENVSVEESGAELIRLGGLAPIEVFDDSGIDKEKFDAEMERVIAEAKKSDGSDIAPELKDAGYLKYNYQNDFFYKQLDNKLKAAYDDLYYYCDYLLTHDYDLTTKYDDRYCVASIKCNTYDDTQKMKAFAYAFVYSNPQFFFIGKWKLAYSNDRIWLFTYDGYEDGTKRIKAANEINIITSYWLNDINKGKDFLEKESIIYKKMAAEITYEWEIDSKNRYVVDNNGNSKPCLDPHTQTIAGALLKKSCVCAGYAKLFVYFCHLIGIEAIGVVGDDHAWNIVNLYGKWYEIDPTGMDLINEKSYKNNKLVINTRTIDYNYCNCGKNVLRNYSGYTNFKYLDLYNSLFFFPDLSSSYGQPIYIDTSIIYAANGQAIIKWENMNEKFYGSYPMEYAFYTYQNGKYTCVGTHAQITDDYGYYTFNNLKNGVNYGFLVRVKIWNNYLKKYVWTGYTSNNVKYATIQGAMNYPVITSVTTEYNSAKITWTSVPNATQYAVYTYVNDSYTCMGATASNSFTVSSLNQGTTYGFLVRAYINGKWSPYSTSDIRFATTLRNSDITINANEEEEIRVYNYV